MRVFGWSANPSIDSPKYHQSNARAAALLEAQTHFLTKDAYGKDVLQEYPPAEERQIFSQFQDAWRMKPSGGMPVWQMVTQ